MLFSSILYYYTGAHAREDKNIVNFLFYCKFIATFVSGMRVTDEYYGYACGWIERVRGGRYEGGLVVEGVDISPIEGVYFQQDGRNWLWLKRKPLLEYDLKSEKYLERPREPRWEVYLEKQGSQVVAYRGTFAFLHFRFQITGIWDVVLGKDKGRLNLFVERLPAAEQTIINAINERNRNGQRD